MWVFFASLTDVSHSEVSTLVHESAFPLLEGGRIRPRRTPRSQEMHVLKEA